MGMHVLQRPIIPVGHRLNMLRGNVIGDIQHVLMAVAQHDLAVVFPTPGRGVTGGQDLQQTVDLGEGFIRQFAGIRHEDRR